MYAKVECQFWADPLVRSLSEDARILLFYYITTPARNFIGLYHLPEPLALYHLHWQPVRYRKAQKELSEKCRILVDFDADLILVVNHFKHNKPENPNQVKGAVKVLNELPDTKLFITLYDLAKTYIEPEPEPLLKALKKRIETVSKPFLNPFGTGNRGSGLDDQPGKNGENVDNSQEPAPNLDLETVSEPFRNPFETNNNSNNNSNNTIVEKSTEGAPKKKTVTKAEAMAAIDEYNAILTGSLPAVKSITEKRIEAMKRILTRYDAETWKAALYETKNSAFLTGGSFSCSFDWIVQEKNLVKILEGNYRNKTGPRNTTPPPRGIAGLAEIINGSEEEEWQH